VYVLPTPRVREAELGTIRFWNRGAEQTFGFAQSAALGLGRVGRRSCDKMARIEFMDFAGKRPI
jgi:hypothetical protein